ncbi:uncharacterized protein NPIL_501431 [Nephila pilipes]|uniref:Uncharacterized protein n=1 Tax=Nephila pilipes TaxID=299642 RepID=A0A8X6Q8H9_NEPPI|nr:uncharacterized protein NPIL_501431 [Nephila pilipes]
MENRRLFSVRPAPTIGVSNVMSPQMENFALVLRPLSTKGLREEYKKKEYEDFGIVLNVGNAKPSEIKIVYGKGDVVEIKIDQPPTPFNGIIFSRKCSYRYELPEDVDKSTLIALRTRDDFLIILPISLLREDWENSKYKEPVASEIEEIETRDKAKEKDQGHAKEQGEGQAKEADKEQGEGQAKETGEGSAVEVVVLPESEVSQEKRRELEKRREESDKKCPPGSLLEQTEMNRVYRPNLDVLILRQHLLNIERFVCRLRRSVENTSFVNQGKFSVEDVIYNSAKQSLRYFRGLDVQAPPGLNGI